MEPALAKQLLTQPERWASPRGQGCGGRGESWVLERAPGGIQRRCLAVGRAGLPGFSSASASCSQCAPGGQLNDSVPVCPPENGGGDGNAHLMGLSGKMR